MLTIDRLLADNGLARKEIPEGQNSLMRAISEQLYATTAHHETLKEINCNKCITSIIKKSVPLNLSILETNLALQQDYCQHPSFIGFDKINLELVSALFYVKVIVYQVEDDWLTTKIVNKNYTRTIEIVKHGNHYDPVYKRSFMENAVFAQQICYEIVATVLKDDTKQTIKQYKNIEQELWMQDKIAQQIEQKQVQAQNQGGRVRSLSDQFNYDLEKVDALYTSLEAKFTRMFSQVPVPTPQPVKKGQLDMDYASSQILKLQNQLENLATGGKSTGKSNMKFEIPDEIIQQQQNEQIKNIRGNPPGIQAPKQAQAQNSSQAETPKKPLVIDESDKRYKINPQFRYTGRLKFFDEGKNYGFIVLDTDNSDIFVHADDLQKVGITKEFLRGQGQQYKSQTGVRHFGKGPGQAPRFSFTIMVYVGKYNKSRKAVDLKFLVEN